MRTYHSAYGYDGTGAKEQMIAKIQDIKASPESGKTRLIVREKDKIHSHASIDIDMKHAKELKTKETYVFQVNEKDHSRMPGFQRKKSAEHKAFHCHEDPSVYVPGSELAGKMSRFGGASTTGNAGRIKF